jgi:hypothetical protein
MSRTIPPLHHMPGVTLNEITDTVIKLYKSALNAQVMGQPHTSVPDIVFHSQRQMNIPFSTHIYCSVKLAVITHFLPTIVYPVCCDEVHLRFGSWSVVAAPPSRSFNLARSFETFLFYTSKHYMATRDRRRLGCRLFLCYVYQLHGHSRLTYIRV